MTETFSKDRSRELPNVSEAARDYALQFLREELLPNIKDLAPAFRAEVVALLSHLTGKTEEELIAEQIEIRIRPYKLRERLAAGEHVDDVLFDYFQATRRRVAELVDQMVPGLTLQELRRNPAALMLRWHKDLVITD